MIKQIIMEWARDISLNEGHQKAHQNNNKSNKYSTDTCNVPKQKQLS